MTNERRSWRSRVEVAAALLAGAVAGCGIASDLPGVSTNAVASVALTYASTTDSAGTLVCTPSETQIEVCAGLAAGDACTLVSSDGTQTWSGTCRTTIDGATVACAPNSPAPPAELESACSGLTAGAACTVTDKLGSTRDGVCVVSTRSATLICGRKETPSAEATAACSEKVAGASCTTTGGKKAFTGVCSLGPAGTGVLACTRAHELVSPSVAACSGLQAGASCSMGKSPWALVGNCVTSAAGDSIICVLPCGNLGGRFDCDGRQDADGGLYARGRGGRPGNNSGGGGLPPGMDGGWPNGGGGGLPPGMDGGWPNSGGGSSGSGGSSGTGGGSGGSSSSCVHNDSRCSQSCSTCHG